MTSSHMGSSSTRLFLCPKYLTSTAAAPKDSGNRDSGNSRGSAGSGHHATKEGSREA